MAKKKSNLKTKKSVSKTSAKKKTIKKASKKTLNSKKKTISKSVKNSFVSLYDQYHDILSSKLGASKKPNFSKNSF